MYQTGYRKELNQGQSCRCQGGYFIPNFHYIADSQEYLEQNLPRKSRQVLFTQSYIQFYTEDIQ